MNTMSILDLLYQLRGSYLTFEVWFRHCDGSWYKSFERSWECLVDRFLDNIASSEGLCLLDITDSHISSIYISHSLVQIILKLSDGEECYFD